MSRDTIVEDTTLVTKSVQRLKVDTPLGSIESDSVNHWIDILTIVGVILVLYVGKKLIDKFFRGEK